MKITTNKYVIVTNESPLRFNYGYGEETDVLESAEFYSTKEDAGIELNNFDEPEAMRIVSVKITYEF